jgi:hypothetical protein
LKCEIPEVILLINVGVEEFEANKCIKMSLGDELHHV